MIVKLKELIKELDNLPYKDFCVNSSGLKFKHERKIITNIDTIDVFSCEDNLYISSSNDDECISIPHKLISLEKQVGRRGTEYYVKVSNLNNLSEYRLGISIYNMFEVAKILNAATNRDEKLQLKYKYTIEASIISISNTPENCTREIENLKLLS